MRHTSFTLRCTSLALLIPLAALPQEPATAPPLAIQPGTVLTMRINEGLSSDQNQSGDPFSGTLTQPVVVRGIVVAQRGQTVTGRVLEATKAGRVSGTSSLRLALSSLTLADGQTVPLQSQMIVRSGPTSEGRDAAAIAGTTGLGAVVGALADGGRGAAIGAGAGAFASTVGVLLTRGRPTIIYPESALSFQITAPVEINTENSLQAFHAVNPKEYAEATPPELAPVPQTVAPVAPPLPPPAVYPYAYPYPYYVYPAMPYPYYYTYPRYYGPSVRLFFGVPRYYGPRVYYYPRYVPRHVPRRGPVIVHRGGRRH